MDDTQLSDLLDRIIRLEVRQATHTEDVKDLRDSNNVLTSAINELTKTIAEWRGMIKVVSILCFTVVPIIAGAVQWLINHGVK